jgi:hypothetical protein
MTEHWKEVYSRVEVDGRMGSVEVIEGIGGYRKYGRMSKGGKEVCGKGRVSRSRSAMFKSVRVDRKERYEYRSG